MISILTSNVNISVIKFITIYYNKINKHVYLISDLNESLVNLLLERDELHMAKDSMLVDIEDLKHITRMSY